MKLRFKYEINSSTIPQRKVNFKKVMETYEKELFSENKRGMLVFESDPQIRTIFTSDNRGIRRVPFPYFINVICYSFKENVYKYGGIYDSGLRVFFRNSPMTSFKDEVFLPPTDANRFGLVCTPHDHDEKTFKTLEELASHVATLWWQIVHTFEYEKKWAEMTLEQALAKKWRNAGSFPDALRQTAESGYGRANSFYPPEDSVLIDEVWPPKSPIVKAIEDFRNNFLENALQTQSSVVESLQ